MVARMSVKALARRRERWVKAFAKVSAQRNGKRGGEKQKHVKQPISLSVVLRYTFVFQPFFFSSTVVLRFAFCFFFFLSSSLFSVDVSPPDSRAHCYTVTTSSHPLPTRQPTRFRHAGRCWIVRRKTFARTSALCIVTAMTHQRACVPHWLHGPCWPLGSRISNCLRSPLLEGLRLFIDTIRTTIDHKYSMTKYKPFKPISATTHWSLSIVSSLWLLWIFYYESFLFFFFFFF
jgi:hypothetical protein